MSRPPTFDWTDERLATLKRMWAARKTAPEIVAAIGHGVTRGMIMGKIFRLGLSATRPPKEKRPPAEPKPRPPRLPVDDESRATHRAYMRDYRARVRAGLPGRQPKPPKPQKPPKEPKRRGYAAETDPVILAARAERKRFKKRLAQQARREAARIALGLPPGMVRRPPRKVVVAPKPRPARVPPPSAPEEVSGGTVRFLDRRPLLECAWPEWSDPRPPIDALMVCGRPVIEGDGQPLCAWHRFIGHSRGTTAERSALRMPPEAAHA